ncbi:hypothetical protein L596_025370 [Steinernema carpocapsae]|uniref:Uncharacterized protein n=1 Tax=Steinernema carpocapsae TaxID=34508 RepID=A0A4U5M7M6_STECR|nr:hypothetical protein L596_025370 [Steinernema carpocapsae]
MLLLAFGDYRRAVVQVVKKILCLKPKKVTVASISNGTSTTMVSSSKRVLRMKIGRSPFSAGNGAILGKMLYIFEVVAELPQCERSYMKVTYWKWCVHYVSKKEYCCPWNATIAMREES